MAGEGTTFSAQSYFDAIVALGAVPVVTDLQGATAFAQLQAQFNALVGAGGGGGGGASLLVNAFFADDFIGGAFGIIPYNVGGFNIESADFPDGSVIEIVMSGRYGNSTGGNINMEPIVSFDILGDFQMGAVQVTAAQAPNYERHYNIASVAGQIYVMGSNFNRTFAGAANPNQAQVLNGSGFPIAARPAEPFTIAVSFAEFFNSGDPAMSAVLNQVQAKVWTP